MNDIRTSATPFQKREVGNVVLRTFLKIFAPYVTCYNTINIRRPDISLVPCLNSIVLAFHTQNKIRMHPSISLKMAEVMTH